MYLSNLTRTVCRRRTTDENYLLGCSWVYTGPLTSNEYQSKIKEILELWKSSETDNQGDVDRFIGKLPWYLRDTAGGNTTCIEVEAGGKIIILDAGSGIRPLGLSLMGRAKGKPLDIHIMISHTHWDHICGFPFLCLLTYRAILLRSTEYTRTWRRELPVNRILFISLFNFP